MSSSLLIFNIGDNNRKNREREKEDYLSLCTLAKNSNLVRRKERERAQNEPLINFFKLRLKRINVPFVKEER